MTSSDSALLGRDQELAAVEQWLRQALTGTSAVVVLSGDAGIGKSTLATATVDRARRLGARIAIGHCLDVARQQPFGPVREALRRLGGNEPEAQLEVLAQAVHEAAAAGPVALLLEDLHWADQATQDLVRTLAHTAEGPLLLLLTVRSEDVPRGHPVGDLLRDASRSAAYHRVDLGPLDEDALRELAERRSGLALLPGLVSELARRSTGNPLYAEELLDADALGAGDRVPPPLADLFLAKVARLPDAAVQVLRVAAVTGTRVDESLVVAATGTPAEEVRHVLRLARDHQLLAVRDGQVEFRHGLLRDALYDDLMPGERTALHARVADVLAERRRAVDAPDLALLGGLAFHARAAGDLETALAASVAAGQRWPVEGPAAALEHLGAALDLWDRVSDPEQVTGVPHAELLRTTGEATADHGRVEDARVLLRAAVEEAEAGQDRLLVSRTYTTYYRSVSTPGDELSERALDAALQAAGPGPSPERGAALFAQSIWHALAGRLRTAIAVASELVGIAEALHDRRLEASGRSVRGLATAQLGRVRAGEAETRTGIALFREVGDRSYAIYTQQQLAWTLAQTGPSEPARLLALDAAEEAARLGMPGARQLALEQLVAIELWRGELVEAERLFEEMRRSGLFAWRLPFMSLDVLTARGDLDAVSAEWAAMGAQEPANGPGEAPNVLLAAMHTEYLLAVGDLPGATERMTAAQQTLEVSEDARDWAAAAAYGFFVLREHARRGLVPDPALRQAATRTLRALDALPAADREEWAESWRAAYVVAARACEAALDGKPSVELWRQAVEVLGRTGFVLWRLRIQPYLAEDLWEAGDRAAARVVVHDTWHEATRRGFGSVARHAEAVARSRRISLPEQPLPGVQSRLTPREREVLALLDRGATNRQIAQELFISEKTVSVHVSNVLAKLGASHRGEAVALARRASEVT